MIKVYVDQQIKQRAEQLEQQGIKSMDALHVAASEASKSDYFLTCDKRLINRCRELVIKVIKNYSYIVKY